MRYIPRLFLSVMLLALSSGIAAETLRVSYIPDIPPHSMESRDGRPEGFYIDLFTEIARLEGWNYEFVRGSWMENFTRAQNSEIDILIAGIALANGMSIATFNWFMMIQSEHPKLRFTP